MKDIPIIFEHGANEGIDKRVLPLGWFKTAQNTRFRKDGRLGKRLGYTTRAVTTASGVDANSPAQLITTHQDTELLGSNGLLWAWDGAKWSAPLNGSTPMTVLSDYEPVKKTLASADEERNSLYTTVASSGGYRFVNWSNNAGLFVRCEKEATGAIVFIQRLDGGGTATEGRLTTEPGKVICVWRDGTSIKLLSCTLASIASGFVGAQTLAAATATATAGYDITPAADVGSGSNALVFQSGATQITLAKFTSAGVASSVNFADATAAGDISCGVFFGGAGVGNIDNKIYVLWRVGGGAAAGFIRCRVYANNGLSAPGSATATIDVNTLATNTGRPTGVFTIVSGNNGRAQAVWSGVVTTQPRMYAQGLEWTTTPQVANLGSLTTRGEFRNASKPWSISPDSSGSSGLFVWAHVGRSTSVQPGFHLMEINWDGDGRSHMRMAYGSAYYQDHAGPPAQGASGSSWNPAQASSLGEWLWSFPEIIRGFNNGTPLVGAAQFRYTHKVARPNRAVASISGSTYVAGGWLTQFDGRNTIEQGFAWAPEILSLTEGVGGALTALGTYQYVCVYEGIDILGNRHQSEPSLPATKVLTGGNNQITVVATGLDHATLRRSILYQAAHVVMHVYRTTNLGRTFTRVTPDVGAPVAAGYGISGPVTFTDTIADTAMLDNEGLYTQGGPLPHTAPPACGHVWAGQTRLCVSRLADRSMVQFSKLHVPGEPIEWADSDSFRSVIPGGGDVECAAEMDGIWYIFTPTEIFAVVGDGPDDKGQGDFQAPVRLPSPVGCKDWRSLVMVPQGLMFFGGAGIYLLPRGGGSPVWAGQPLRDELGAFDAVVGATYDLEDNAAIFGVSIPGGAVKLLVFDIRNGEWSVDTIPPTSLQSVGSWTGRTAFGSTAALWVRLPSNTGVTGYFDTATDGVSQTLQVGELAPFGIDGFGRVRTLRFLGEYRSDAGLTASAYFDGATTPSTGVWYFKNAAAVVADFGSWTLSNLTRTAGQADPDGGTGAFLLTESNDILPQFHTVTITGTANLAVGMVAFEVWARPLVDRFMQFQVEGAPRIGYDFDNQVFGSAINCTGTLIETRTVAGVLWHHLHVETTAGTSTTMVLVPCVSPSGASYFGHGLGASVVYAPVIIQRSIVGLVPGDRWEVQWDLPRQKLTSLSVKLVDTNIDSGTNPGEGLVFHGMTLGKTEAFPGVSRRPASARV